jgi:VWFA-related protein
MNVNLSRWTLISLLMLLGIVPLSAQFKRAESPQPPAAAPQSSTQQSDTRQSDTQQAPPAQEDQVIKIDVSLVNLYFCVRENRGGYVSNLTQDDFEVYEDGKLQTVKAFSRETDQPLTLGLLVDVSKSQERLIEDERAASSRFFEQVLRPKDEAFLLSFGVESELLQDLTNSHTLLAKALRTLRLNAGVPTITPTTVPRDPRGTVLYEAVWLAANEKMRPEVGRKALVLITDGDDQGSRTKPSEAVEAAQKADSIIYVILYEDPYYTRGMFGGAGEGAMRKLTDETGGRVFRVDRKYRLSDIYDQLQQELRSQYVIAYSSTSTARDGGFHKVEIRVKNRKDLKVQARKGYYAVPAGSE